MSIIRMLLFIAVAFLLSACAEMGKVKGKVDSMLQPSTAEQRLSSGVKSYEDGDYKSSLEALRDAEKMGLSHKDDLISAHKYSAFIYCITEQKNKCRHEFEDVLELDPNFDLLPAEAGHPAWGPVFRAVKAGIDK